MTNIQILTVENSIKNNAIETAVLFTEDGNFIDAVKGTNNQVNLASFEGFTKNAILTHNHPKGSSLSMEDIQYFLYNGLKEIRAVSANHTFTLELKKEVKDAQAEFKKLQEKLQKVIKELKQAIKDSIINDTELHFEDIDHEAIKQLFKCSRTFKYTHTSN